MLDINTEKGQKTLLAERKMAQRVAEWAGADLVETPKTMPAIYDGVFIRDGEIVAVYECSCRNLKLGQYPTIVRTKEKLDGGAIMSKMTGAPYLLLVYLQKSENILVFKMTNEHGEWMFDFSSRTTSTQKTVNGGTIFRLNSYIPVKKASVIKMNH